jgi:hypothetical protein
MSLPCMEARGTRHELTVRLRVPSAPAVFNPSARAVCEAGRRRSARSHAIACGQRRTMASGRPATSTRRRSTRRSRLWPAPRCRRHGPTRTPRTRVSTFSAHELRARKIGLGSQVGELRGRQAVRSAARTRGGGRYKRHVRSCVGHPMAHPVQAELQLARHIACVAILRARSHAAAVQPDALRVPSRRSAAARPAKKDAMLPGPRCEEPAASCGLRAHSAPWHARSRYHGEDDGREG